ncbi:hypothetical protein GQ602_006614 [Ophiocordyceps camponoti-floridani]|uniref:Uncharacterized protein n=1 Tax=Ophiocordyceps camponoti-floridani TaxID=2030778 RepID=A0A8H4Q1I2_9HYPO|nr:hypothetical protein GQ602_006614 [Ophiocordyceps camponoti-floridani]
MYAFLALGSQTEPPSPQASFYLVAPKLPFRTRLPLVASILFGFMVSWDPALKQHGPRSVRHDGRAQATPETPTSMT